MMSKQLNIFENATLNEKTEFMINVYENWPEYAKKSYNNAEQIDMPFDDVLFCGMGGSGVVFDVLSSLLPDKHVKINKGYVPPKNIGNSLVVFNSASGNTMETVTALKITSKITDKIIVFSSGGKLERFCDKNKITHIKYDLQSSPRASIPFSLYTIFGTLSDSFGIQKNSITKSIKSLQDIKKKLFQNSDNPALDLAKFIDGYPVCYHSPELFPAALRFSQDFQENCKKFATQGDVVESCHNSINAWEYSKGFNPILLASQNDDKYVKKNFEIWKEYLDTRKIPYHELHSVKGDLLTQFMTLMYQMGMSTIYHAVQNNIDPTLLKAIDFVKARV